jgi:hemoglobin
VTPARAAGQNAGVTQASGATPYEQFGGHDFFVRLVGAFYEGVATDAVLRPLYPDQDLGPAEERLRMFLEQYWGGPTTYSDQRGHPRLRMRHAPYPVDPEARDRWLAHMRAALDRQGLPDDLDAQMWGYLVNAAFAMVNVLPTPGPQPGNAS